ncbi:Bile salt-activated lipase [Liparis tanakae]|uniref:Bile salt-activated lipase n=1 Tax=Liparis tanakae TaxID=230148 RepID=A0A4Z2FRJ3_9TELE|nr:Bile salt-activated lipase [Liparis tanakae]
MKLGLVSTEGGMVRGEEIRLGFRRTMDVFKGIPFADIPGRFEKPKRHPGWDGVLKTTEYRDTCMQMNMFISDTKGSEDCLFLNIWVPHGRSVSYDLPVMVWIHGGGFLVGGSMGTNLLNNYLFGGQEIADKGNVIVVTVNYRVGTLGFLSTGESDLPGNYGLWDQQAAIAWVHRNIRTFGGDPDNITIFGESAGGASVNLQAITPHNKGLIKRAISQSGVAVCPWAINENPRRFTEEVAAKVGCPTDQNMASCLKMTDPAKLTLAGSLNLSSSPDYPILNNLVLSPVIDGDFLPDEPSKLFHNAAEIDYIAGVNDMDGHVSAGFNVPSINSLLSDTPIDDVKRLLASYTKQGKAALDQAFYTYSSTWVTNPSRETIKKTVVAIETDYLFLIPTQAALYLHANNATTGRTYSYLFSEPNRMGGVVKPYPSWVGADHGDDLQYVFGMPFTTPLVYRPRHRDVSGYLIAYWTNFARTGGVVYTRLFPIRGGGSCAYKYPLGVVQTEGGGVQGLNIPLGLFRSVDVFKGIPFAAKPGTFEKPQPHPGWDGIRKATKFAPRCLQVNMLLTSSYGSEDCLYLNIWVPHGRQGSLFVFICSIGGSITDTVVVLISGQEIADKGDVIVVSVGYRVGTLGFLSTGDSLLPGNYGLWDQHAAIAWVHRNIRTFGGDPDNITIFGESAGGASVSFQPFNLFHNAAEVDYLAGVNDMDGHLFTLKDIPSLGDKNQETPIEDVKRLLAAYTKEMGPAASEIAFAEYSSNWGSTPSQDSIRRTAVDIGTDYIFLVPVQTAIYLHAANARSGRTYSYRLSEPSLMAGPGKPYHDWVGADHADDLQYVFGKPFTTPKAYGDRHRDLSGFIIAYWTNFARTGNPNKGTLKVPVTWPAFTRTEPQFLDINAKMNDSSIGRDMRLHFVRLWASTLPSFPSPGAADAQ